MSDPLPRHDSRRELCAIFVALVRFLCHDYRCPDHEWNGVVAQLVERLVRNEKVAGSIPVGSTIQLPAQIFTNTL